MDWSWAVGGITNDTPRTMGPECENYMSNHRRWTESIVFCSLFLFLIKLLVQQIEPIQLPPPNELRKPHSPIRLMLMIFMTLIFGIEIGFKLANRNVIYVLNPCHIQTIVQIYLLAAKPSKLTTALFRIQMNNLNGPFLAFIFPEVDTRTYPFEQATYWIQHAMLCVITVYILRTGLYKVEDIRDIKWTLIGVMVQLVYCFGVLNFFSVSTGVNLNKILCADESDPFQGENYRIAAIIHETLLCPILNKLTVYIFSIPEGVQRCGTTIQTPVHQQQYSNRSPATKCRNLEGHEPMSCDAIETTKINTSQLIYRRTSPLDYQQQQYRSSSSALHRGYDQENQETVVKDKVIHDHLDDLDMEVIEATSAASTEASQAEYKMSTTKVD